MIDTIKTHIEQELSQVTRTLTGTHRLREVSPILSRFIQEFVQRSGKRLRPVLFVLSYLGFSSTPARNYYTTAAAFELLHDFMLVHDDIIDKSRSRRGAPAMHIAFDEYIQKHTGGAEGSGVDLAIILGDVLFALAIEAFLAIDEDMVRKHRALQKFVETAVYTGAGEFKELLNGFRDIDSVSKEDIFATYDYKSAYYTFAAPLVTGAILAQNGEDDIRRLSYYGLLLGRAFQIKDDLDELINWGDSEAPESCDDIREAKRTLVLWHAYHQCGAAEKKALKIWLSKSHLSREEARSVHDICKSSRALTCAEQEIDSLLEEAGGLCRDFSMHPDYKTDLETFVDQIFKR